MKYEEVVRVVNEILNQYPYRLTVRQIYYRCISPPYQIFGATKTYKSFDKILTRAREREDVNWMRIEDRARRIAGGDYGW
jgi:hypothetical protein